MPRRISVHPWHDLSQGDLLIPLVAVVLLALMGHGSLADLSRETARIEVALGGGGLFCLVCLSFSRLVRRTRAWRESEERMVDATYASSDWFWETGPDGRFSWFCLWVEDPERGFDPAKALGRVRQDMIDPHENDPAVIASHLEDLAHHRPFRDFIYWARPPGSPPDTPLRLIHVNGKPRFDAAGRFLGYRGTAADFTERKATEDRARRAEQRLSEAIDSLPDGFALWDKDDRLVLWNNAFISFFPKMKMVPREGMPFEEAVRLNLGDGETWISGAEAAGRDGADGAAGIQARMRCHREANGAVELLEPSGRRVLISERRVAEGQVLSIYSDITERKAMEMELADSEAGLRAFLGITSDTSLSFDERIARLLDFGMHRFGMGNGIVLELRDGIVRRIHGFGPIVGLDPSPPVMEESVSGLCLRTHGPVVLTDVFADSRVGHLPRVKRLGMWAYLGMRLSHRSSLSGVLCFFDGKPRARPFSRGDTQLLELMAQWVGSELFRRDSERTVRMAMEEAKLANRAKSEFLANMSHELRTPLNAILGFSDVMGQEMFGPLGADRYREYAQAIHDSGGHLLAIINDILDVAKIEAGRMDLSEEVVLLAPLIEDCLRLVVTRARDGGIRLEKALPRVSPRVRIDDRRMKQVLINILSNAVKFTPQGGVVRVTLSCLEPDGGVEITLSDTGVGMEEGEIRVALSPFGQIDSGLDRRHEGTGLGLPLAKSLMEMHGGTLTLRSVPGEGTRVVLALPRERVLGTVDVMPDAETLDQDRLDQI